MSLVQFNLYGDGGGDNDKVLTWGMGWKNIFFAKKSTDVSIFSRAVRSLLRFGENGKENSSGKDSHEKTRK